MERPLHSPAGREFAAAPASGGAVLGTGAPALERSRLGVVTFTLGLHQRAAPELRAHKDYTDPLTFLEQCHRLGAGGVQMAIGIREPAYARELRRRAEALGMFIEGIVEPPWEAADVAHFEQQVTTAREAGATVARTVIIPGRRYEQFDSADEFQSFARRGWQALQWAEPVLARHRFRLAVENHKDHRVGERVEMIQTLGSEWIGICVDFGNNLALLEDPLETMRAFAPWAFTVHIKDHAVREYADGFLLADAALGDGFFDLPEMARILRQARPEVRFNLEVITRDPLRIPVFTPKYWATMPDLPARDLARTWQLLKTRASAAPLGTITALPPERRLAVERANIERSFAYARERLSL